MVNTPSEGDASARGRHNRARWLLPLVLGVLAVSFYIGTLAYHVVF